MSDGPIADRPLNYAHRGASHDAPANTLAAFNLAAELGADGIELDVHLSEDGEAVVIHDFCLDATTDGHGQVRDHSLPQLRELDAGSWFDEAFAGQRIPTLQEVVDVVGHRLLMNIELKTKGLRAEGLVAEVVRIVEDNNLSDRTIISSFDPIALRRVRRANPTLSLGLLYSPDQIVFLRKAWPRHLVQVEALHPHYSLVTSKYVRWARGKGYRLHVWTADDPAAMQALIRHGVDIIITNRPDVLGEILQKDLGG
jgi:glycerophosphoryl diester phosphodiesterase